MECSFRGSVVSPAMALSCDPSLAVKLTLRTTYIFPGKACLQEPGDGRLATLTPQQDSLDQREKSEMESSHIA